MALTRAKTKIVLVGSLQTLRSIPILEQLIHLIEENDWVRNSYKQIPHVVSMINVFCFDSPCKPCSYKYSLYQCTCSCFGTLREIINIWNSLDHYFILNCVFQVEHLPPKAHLAASLLYSQLHRGSNPQHDLPPQFPVSKTAPILRNIMHNGAL